MSKIDEARNILGDLRVPKKQQSDLCCYVLLAIANLKEADSWNYATNEWIRIHDVLVFIKENYGISYAENSRETIRKVALHNFRNAALVEDNKRPTNSPAYKYRITEEALALIKKYGKQRYQRDLNSYLHQQYFAKNNGNDLESIFPEVNQLESSLPPLQKFFCR